jgi:hypothetical protein
VGGDGEPYEMVGDGVVAYVGGDDSLLEGYEPGTRNLKIEEKVICRSKWHP